jgi:nucleoside-diphosphate-sugar epimerase
VPELKLTPGEQKRDFIYIDDVLSAYSTLLDAHGKLNKSFLAFGLGSGQAVRIRDFVELAHCLTESGTELKFGALPYREGEIMESAADIGALECLGWRPAFTLEQGLLKTIEQEKTKALS